MAAKKVDIMELRQLLLLKEKGREQPLMRKIIKHPPQYDQSLRSYVQGVGLKLHPFIKA